MVGLQLSLCQGTAGIERLVLASTSASMRQFGEEFLRLIRTLPPAVCDKIVELSEAKKYDDPAFVAASMEFYRRHVCRLDLWPQGMDLSVTSRIGIAAQTSRVSPNRL